MTTPTSPIQAERDAIAREYAHAPEAEQALLALLSAQTPPAGEDAPPPMPPDLLDRLRGQYGVTTEEPSGEAAPSTRRAPAAPGFLTVVRGWFSLPSVQWGGLAAACVAVVMGVMLTRPPAPVPQENAGTAPDQWRGSPAPAAQTGPIYVWLGSTAPEARAAVAGKVPDLVDAATEEDAQQLSIKNPQATVYVLDPAAGTVSVQIQGQAIATRPIRPGAPGDLVGGLLDALRRTQRAQAP